MFSRPTHGGPSIAVTTFFGKKITIQAKDVIIVKSEEQTKFNHRAIITEQGHYVQVPETIEEILAQLRRAGQRVVGDSAPYLRINIETHKSESVLISRGSLELHRNVDEATMDVWEASASINGGAEKVPLRDRITRLHTLLQYLDTDGVPQTLLSVYHQPYLHTKSNVQKLVV